MSINGIPKSFYRKIVNCGRFLTHHEFQLFHGENYTGKTHTACHLALAQYHLGRARTLEFITGAGFVADCLSAIASDKSEGILFGRLAKCSILILDDYLGSNLEWDNKWCRRFNELLRKRADNNKITLITTNVDPKEMVRKKLDPKIASRLVDTKSDMTRHQKFWPADPPFTPYGLGESWPMQEVDKLTEDLTIASDFVIKFKTCELKKEAGYTKNVFNALSPAQQRLVYHLIEDEYQTNPNINLKSELWTSLK